MPEITDNILVARTREDLQNFSEIYEKYVNKIFRYFATRTADKQLAEDLTSDTFFKALNNFDKYKNDLGTFSSWLFRIGHNLMIDYFRKKKTDPLEDFDQMPSKEKLEEETHVKLIAEEIYKLLADFDKEEKEIFLLKITSQLKFKEIAEITGKSENTIKTKYFRTLKKLKGKAEDLNVLVLFL